MSVRVLRNDSELGAWTHLELRPRTHGSMIESVWSFDGAIAGREQFYPTGTLDLLIQLDGSSTGFRIVDGQPAEHCPQACMAGLLLKPLVIETPAETTSMVGVRLRPAGAAALFGVPLNELTGTAVRLDELIGAEGTRIGERLHETGSHADRLRLLARWVSARMTAGIGTETAVTRAVSEIERRQGALAVADLVGASPKSFRRRFVENVGVGPKTFARIVRFRRTADLLARSAVPLPHVAAAHGYFDQAHMSAEFRAFAGMPPGRFRATARRPGSEGIVA
ncbi:helix-turn-helix domain-containing protein [Tsukamurella tyrosinosolvens]|uniref:helix-turn-helix domain-containing protein n=1 Tax=Tsukamurella tyrosinosolvens TaxID=57704 RepID=UPI002DD4386D|nr:helix-turn-helix domain-containing protein [Tsukamurella tyrosinosolvens]MEC4616020.1 helix-turn-helix domain-containing protein [Tsukamurella tyrosinosolvens]